MILSICPSDIVEAPLETVWALLTNARGWGDFFDAEVLSVEPDGPARAGQRMRLASGRWPFRFRLLFEFSAVDFERHNLRLEIRLPFGVVNHEALHVEPLSPTRCQVSYGCNFEFPAGWRGRLLWLALKRGFETGPADSLARLKRHAETMAANSPARPDAPGSG